jgi:hypothetical protein
LFVNAVFDAMDIDWPNSPATVIMEIRNERNTNTRQLHFVNTPRDPKETANNEGADKVDQGTQLGGPEFFD